MKNNLNFNEINALLPYRPIALYNIVMTKIIALVDCDSFFVSCEQAVNPELKDKPVCVLSNRDGCVVARSREAKKLGIKMGMPYFMAKQDFPQAIYVSGHHDLYGEISDKVMSVLREISPTVDVYSIDEAFVDLTGLERLYKMNSVELAKFIRAQVREKVDIPVSIGVSSTKTLAKLASDKAKDSIDGVYFIGQGNLIDELKQTSVEEIWGIGRNLTITMRKNGILNAYELVQKSDVFLDKLIGIKGLEMKHELLGEVVSPVTNVVKPPKSIQKTSALAKFSSDKAYLKNSINYHIHSACSKLRKLEAKTLEIGVLLRTKDYRVFIKKEMLNKALDFELEISKIIFKLFDEIYDENLIYRSSGVFFEKLVYNEAQQGFLFNEEVDERKEKLSQCFDKLEAKFGKNIIQTGFVKKDI